ELLEERRIGAPVAWPAEGVTLQIAKFAFPRIREDRIVERVAIPRQIELRIAIDVRTPRQISAGINIGAGAVLDVEGQPALNRGVRVELPAAEEEIHRTRDAAEKAFALANR